MRNLCSARRHDHPKTRHSGVEPTFRRAVGLSPNVPGLLGAVVKLLRIPQSAIRSLPEPAVKSGADPLAYAGRGDMLRKSGDLGGAERAYRAAARMDPNEQAYRWRLASTLFVMGRDDNSIVFESFVLLCELIAETPGDGRFQLFASRIQERLGLAAAERIVRQVLRFNPENPALYGALAEVLNRQGRTDEALGLLLSFAQAETQDPHIYAHIARLRAARGNLAGAAEAYRKAIELAPSTLYYQQALTEILERRSRLGRG